MRHSRSSWPPAVRAILWMDAVLVIAGILAFARVHPALGSGSGTWTWTALAGSTLTAGLAALSAFETSVPGRGRAWAWLPVPALALWLAATGLDCAAIPEGAHAWGSTLAEAGQCLRFLLSMSVPLLVLILAMLWWMAPARPALPMLLGALASAGGAASLLALVHPHPASFLDLAAAHAVALLVVLAAGAAASRLPQRKRA